MIPGLLLPLVLLFSTHFDLASLMAGNCTGFPSNSGVFFPLLTNTLRRYFFVLHGYDWIHWVAKSCTTTAYLWLFRECPSSLRTLWSAVVMSPNLFWSRYGCASAFPARSPCYFGSHADVAILVFREVRLILCLPDTTFTRGSEADSREELASASLCSGTLSSTRFSVKTSNHSGKSRNGFLSVPSRCLVFCFGFGFSSGSRDGSPRSLSMLLVLSLSCWYGMLCRN